MKNAAIYQEITPIFQDVFDDDTVQPRPDMTAKDVKSWDSLSHIRLICAIEQHYTIRFSMSEIGGLKTVGDFVTLIVSKKG